MARFRSVHIVTSATAAFDDSAAVMAQSFLAHHPGSTCWLFMPDDPNGNECRASDEVCRRVTIAELPIDGAEFFRQATIYNPGELAQSSKPLLLQAVLDQVGEACAYVDADIEFYRGLDDLPDVLGDAELALTPHWSGPQHAAEPTIDHEVLLTAGAFNSGFVVASPRGRPFLQWWQQRCRRDAIHDRDHHLFVDQRWLDLAAAQFRCRVIHDPGYNVAYWNVAERGLTVDGGEYRAGGAPLRFFHFSGFDPAQPQVLSSYTDDGYLVRLELPALRQLLAEHAAALEHAGHGAPIAPYPFASAANGLPLDLTVRRLAREAMKSEEQSGRPAAVPNPFEEADAPRFVDWLNEPVPSWDGGVPLTRYADGRWRYDDQARARFGRSSALARGLRDDPSVSPLLAAAIPDGGDDMSQWSVRESVAQAGVDLDAEIEAGSGRWASVAARRALLRVLAYYEDELRRREAKVVDQLGQAITALDERMDALERAVARIPR